MINRHTIKAYAIANGWKQIKSNLAEGEEFIKDKFLFSLPTVDDLEVEADVLSYAIQQIHNQEEILLLELINKIANQWLAFGPYILQTNRPSIMSQQTKLEKRKAALLEWYKYVDTLTPEEADTLIKPIKDYLDNHPELNWLPFHPDNIPEAKEGYALLIKYEKITKIDVFYPYVSFWADENYNYINEIKFLPSTMPTYKLIQL